MAPHITEPLVYARHLVAYKNGYINRGVLPFMKYIEIFEYLRTFA